MPTCSSVLPSFNPKSVKLALLLLLSPLFFHAQSLTGLWTGSLSNDSNTVRKDQYFEIALTEYKGKVYGYSRSEFIVDDTLYYILKRVKGTIEGDICEVTDDEIISYNFRGKLDKGIKVTSTFRRNQSDSNWHLDGNWKTNATKKYYAVTGKVGLAEEKDLASSKIFPHLEELKLADEVAFYKERKEGPSIVKIARPEKVRTEYTTSIEQTGAASITVAAPVLSAAKTSADEEPATITAVKKPADDLSTTPVNTLSSSSVSPTVVNNKTIRQAVSPIPSSTDEVVADTRPPNNTSSNSITSVETNKTGDKKITAAPPVANNNIPDTRRVVTGQAPTSVTTPPAQTKKQDAVVASRNNTIPANTKAAATKNITSTPANSNEQPVTKAVPATPATIQPVIDNKSVEAATRQSLQEVIAKSAVIGGRKSDFSQVVNFKSDSIELALYDNGEIDGDTVSVYMNGQVLLDKQGLKSAAIKKTIYIKPGQEEDFTLVMFAESLGKYPPNTGLLVIHDGNDVYNLRFSSDFQKSSGIVFRKKK